MAERWIQQYEPTHQAFGNHDWRLQEWMNSPNAIVAHAASTLWERLQKQLRVCKTKTREYDIERGWFGMGGRYWGHGWMYNMQAVRDHAEMMGAPVVIAHLHVPQQARGRTVNTGESYCVGMMADKDKMGYARRNRNTTAWAAGCVWGEISDKDSHLWLSQCQNGGTLPFPI